MNQQAKRLLPLFALFLVTTGCGKKQAEVSGTVTFANQPVPIATITFFDSMGRAVSGDVVEGRYSLTDVPIGENVKAVVTTRAQLEGIKNYETRAALATGRGRPERPLPPNVPMSTLQKRMQEEHNTPEQQEEAKRMQEMKPRVWKLPERYESLETTPLDYTISPGTQTIDISLAE